MQRRGSHLDSWRNENASLKIPSGQKNESSIDGDFFFFVHKVFFFNIQFSKGAIMVYLLLLEN
jgi:hypothetical protein